MCFIIGEAPAVLHDPYSAVQIAGLRDLGIRYGYQRFDAVVMAAVVVILILLVQTIQFLGDRLVRRVNHRA